MSIWNDFGKLTTLKISFPENAAAKRATIFGNGNNQVPVAIDIQINDKEGKRMSFCPEDLLKVVTLINYSTGEQISFDGEDSNIAYWNYSSEKGDFPTPLGYDLSEKNKSSDALSSDDVVLLYVSASGISSETDIDIAVQIDVEGVGVFNTTADGTDTKNGPGGTSGSVFKAPSYIHVQAKLPVDYSNHANLKLEQSAWEFVSWQKFYIDDYIWNSPIWGKDDAELHCSEAKVTPNDPLLKFVKVLPTYNVYYASDAQKGEVIWDGAARASIWMSNNDGEVPFVAIGGFGSSIDNPDYDTYLWIPPAYFKESWDVTGHFYTKDSEYYYRAEMDFTAYKSREDDEVKVVGYKIHVPTGKNTGHLNWNDAYGPVSYDVTDNYGNQGKITIKFFQDQSSYKTVGNVSLGLE